jgi:hypothetical protein
MTGQVKEDFIARLGELGATVAGGRLRFRPDLVRQAEFRSAAGGLEYRDVHGQRRSLEVPAGALGFTVCQAPVVLHREGPARVVVCRPNGAVETHPGLELDAATSASVFDRTGAVDRLDVHLGLAD